MRIDGFRLHEDLRCEVTETSFHSILLNVAALSFSASASFHFQK
jgi:hypothetical protein